MNNEEKILLLLEKMDKRMITIEEGQHADRKLTELIATQVGGLTTQVSELTTQVGNITKIVTKIENDHGRKLSALFDGQKQNSDKLDHIDTKVSQHDKFILERIK